MVGPGVAGNDALAGALRSTEATGEGGEGGSGFFENIASSRPLIRSRTSGTIK